MYLTFDDFIDKYGTDKTTNFDLINWSKDLGFKIKYVMRDELASLQLFDLKKQKSTQYIIMNLDSSSGKGTHHTAIYNNPDFKFFLSSFGDPPSTEVIKFFGSELEYSDFQIQ
jgi:hypothetical protein